MVFTRRMISENSDNRLTKVNKKIDKAKKKKAVKVHSKDKDIKNRFDSIEEMLKVCRPLMVSLKCETFDTLMENIEGKLNIPLS